MVKTRWRGALVLCVSVAASLLAWPAAPAQAGGSCSVVVPSRLAVDAPYERFPVTLASDCGSSGTEYASWDVRHSYYGPSEILIFDGSSTDYWEFYDWEEAGRHYVEPSMAHDSNYNDVAQNTRTVDIRMWSRLNLSTARSGSYVTLSSAASYYSPAADGFRPWRSKNVTWQYRTCSTCAWTALKTVATDSYGKASYRFYAPKVREYRAATGSSTNIWGRSTAAASR